MESNRYWQDFGEARNRTLMKKQGRRGPSLERRTEGKGDGGKIIYGGRLMSVDVYLALPTFIRRGITIAV